jgi:hypothetical protein
MPLTGWLRWMLLSAVMAATATFFLALPAVQLGNRALQHRVALPAVTTAAVPLLAPSTPARVCVTRHGLCPIGLVRAGDPCRCPDSLHGSVPGRVEMVGGPPAPTRLRDRPSEEAGDPLFGP